MERAGRLLGKSKVSGRVVSDEQMACSAWATAVGKKIAAHTHAISLVRNRLVIEVEDAVWQRQLFALRGQILAGLERVTGRAIAQELEFRIGIPRRAPQREERTAAPVCGVQPDEADAIPDRVFRNLYKASRKRATA